ncbi:FtsL-like putative cell division protein [Rufibacter psychrotolerans]|uniref:FtsL-like putative cell division protein n=1 Tax=Rufibacter psychrotolerans TaxID=2812556 RepID=UPI0019687594|nr:FtsL-like putative cell division protein [Rufibacter sp. SYSU D00308]
MAVNTVRPQVNRPKANTVRVVPQAEQPRPAKPPRQKGTSLFELLDRYTKVDWFFAEGLPVRYLPKVLFLMVVVLFYIGNTHYAERTLRQIDKTKAETEDLRADYTTLKSDYMEASKQSEVARNVAPYGIVESSTPPIQVVLKKDEY